MSFTSTVKDEVTRIETSKLENISELSAIVRVSASIKDDISIVVENNAVARRTFKLIKNIYESLQRKHITNYIPKIKKLVRCSNCF